MWWSDFYDSDEWDQGKLGTETNFNERTLNIIRYSNQYLQNTGINGFSTFDTNPTSTANMGYKELNDVYGSIMAMVEVGNTLKVYQRTKPCSILIGRQEYMDSEGQSNVVVSNTVLGAVRYSTTNYGTEFPESISANNRYVYGFDIYNGVVWRDSANGIFPISGRSVGVEGSSDYRMATWFKEKAKALLISGASNVNVMSVWDEEYKLLYMSFKDSINDANSEVIAFHEPSNRWISFYDFEQVNHNGYNVFLELDYKVIRGFSAGIGYYFDDSDRFAYFDIDTTNDVSVFPSLITLDMTLSTPSRTASDSGSGDNQELSFTLYTPSIVISYVDFDITSLTFAWNDASISSAQVVVLSTGDATVRVTDITSGFLVSDSLGNPVEKNDYIASGNYSIYPLRANTSSIDDFVGVFSVIDSHYNTASVTLTQECYPSAPSVTLEATSMTIVSGACSAIDGSNLVSITFTPTVDGLAQYAKFKVWWSATIDGDYAGTGDFS
jgi:hypothetical protein